MAERELTCIVCPRGCQLKVTLEGGRVASVSGNICKRGKEYAINECTNPVRVVTSTVKVSDGGVVACKTDRAIPKDKVFECMKAINALTVELPVCVGDVVIEDIFGANVVITQNKG